MSVAAGNPEGNLLRSVYTWGYLISCVNSRAARCFVSCDALSAKNRLSNYWIKKNSDLQNPPSGPPKTFC